MTNSLIIEKAQPQDAKDIIDFLNQVGGESDFLTFGFNEFHISVAEELTIINECLSQNHSLMLIGKINSQIASQLYLDVPSQPRLAHIGYLGLSVKKQFWGMSIGTRMLLEAIRWAKERSLIKIQLQVRIDNLNAIKLYQKFNFTIDGTIKKSLKINEFYYDELLMSLDLE